MPVRKHEGSDCYYTNCHFGRRAVRKSTGTSDRDSAQEYEDRLEATLWDQARLGVKPRYLWQEAVLDYLEQMPDSANKRNTAYALRWINQHLSGMALQDINRGKLAALQ